MYLGKLPGWKFLFHVKKHSSFTEALYLCIVEVCFL